MCEILGARMFEKHRANARDFSVAIGTDLDATGRVFTGHQRPRFAGIIGDLGQNRCVSENKHLL